jgi:hypothetical protein
MIRGNCDMTTNDKLGAEGRFWDFCGFLFMMAGVLALGLGGIARLDERPYGSWLAAGAWFFALGFGLNFLGQLMQIRALLGKMADKQ